MKRNRQRTSLEQAQDQVENMSTPELTKDTLLAVFLLGLIVVVIWLSVWFLFVSRL